MSIATTKQDLGTLLSLEVRTLRVSHFHATPEYYTRTVDAGNPADEASGGHCHQLPDQELPEPTRDGAGDYATCLTKTWRNRLGRGTPRRLKQASPTPETK